MNFSGKLKKKQSQAQPGYESQTETDPQHPIIKYEQVIMSGSEMKKQKIRFSEEPSEWTEILIGKNMN